MPLNHCDVLALLWSSIRAMGCLFGCFRVRDNNYPRPLVSDPVDAKSREAVVSRNQLSSIFLSGDEEDVVQKDRENLVRRSGRFVVDDRELRDEAKFLKVCGTLPETPQELRKASKKLKDTPAQTDSLGHTKYHSWLPNESMRDLIENGKQIDQAPCLMKFDECFEDDTSGSCFVRSETKNSIDCSEAGFLSRVATVANEMNGDRNGSTSSTFAEVLSAVKAQPENKSAELNASARLDIVAEISVQRLKNADLKSDATGMTQTKNKTVQFEVESGTSECSPEVVGQAPGNTNVRVTEPYPTPLKVTDEMQTPGTIYASGNNTRIRSQYVYTVLNPLEDPSQGNILMEQNSVMNQHQTPSGQGKHLLPLETATPNPMLGMRESSISFDLKPDANFGHLQKQLPSNNGIVGEMFYAGNPSKAYLGKNLVEDRPILGVVAAHWNVDKENCNITPKWWDGNGIPNSTTKYKEDQKVSWHATPFEERLEKALSEESFISQRRTIMEVPLAFEHDEDADDTAASPLQGLSHQKSVVTF